MKALEIDPEAAEPHASLAWAHFIYDWDWPAAEKEFGRAMELNPGYATAHQWYAIYLTAMGRTDEAMAHIQKAQELDPLSLSISENAGWIRYCARQYDRAVEQFRKTLELDPDYGHAQRYLGLTYLQKGMYREALAELRKAGEVLKGDTEIQADLALAYALAGERAEARKTLDDLLRLSRERYVSPYLIGSFYAGQGEKDRALEWLEKAYQARSGNLVFLNVDPLYDGLRSDPRFQELIRRLGYSP